MGKDVMVKGSKHSEESLAKLRIANKKRWLDDEYRKSKIQDVATRFWKHVDRRGPEECWEWNAVRTDRGYGEFKFNDKCVHAHRVAFSLSGGIITRELPHVLHHCDNRACCNPKHLYAGTIQHNMRDRSERNRTAHNTGEKNGCAKLTESDVLQIRELYPTINMRQIADNYGITKTTVCDIIHRRIWRHI